MCSIFWLPRRVRFLVMNRQIFWPETSVKSNFGLPIVYLTLNLSLIILRQYDIFYNNTNSRYKRILPIIARFPWFSNIDHSRLISIFFDRLSLGYNSLSIRVYRLVVNSSILYRRVHEMIRGF